MRTLADGGRASWLGPEPVSLGLLALLGGPLGLAASVGPIAGLSVLAGGLLGAMAVRIALGERGRTAAGAPLLLAAGLLAAFAPATLGSEIAAGGAGLAVLIWFAAAPRPGGSWSDAATGLSVPVLAVVVALLSGLVLGGAREYVGIAAGLLVVVLLLVAWLYRHPASIARPAGAQPS